MFASFCLSYVQSFNDKSTQLRSGASAIFRAASRVAVAAQRQPAASRGRRRDRRRPSPWQPLDLRRAGAGRDRAYGPAAAARRWRSLSGRSSDRAAGWTEETLADLRSQTQHHEQPFPQSLDELRELLIDAELTSLQEVLNRALGRFSIGIGDLSDRYPTVYSVAFL